MPVLSIIVPVYRVEKYLRKCVDSILSQTFKDFELILVDDGSPDSCGKICDEYAMLDSRIRVIHQANKGLSAARNAGLDICKGKFIAFVDSDDYIEPNMYEILIRNIIKHNTDIAVCGIKNYFDNKPQNNETESCESFKEMVLTKEQCFDMIFSKNDIITVVAWNKVYRREVFSNIRYPEGQIYEDIYVIVDILSQCNAVFVTAAKLYNYRRHNGSISGSKYNDREIDRIISSEKNYSFFKAYYPQYLEHVKAYLCTSYFLVLGKMVMDFDEAKPEDMKFIVNKLNDKIIFVLKSNEFTLRRKLSAIALRIHPRLFKVCVRLQGKS